MCLEYDHKFTKDSVYSSVAHHLMYPTFSVCGSSRDFRLYQSQSTSHMHSAWHAYRSTGIISVFCTRMRLLSLAVSEFRNE